MATAWLEDASAPTALKRSAALPQSLTYQLKAKLLGPALTREALKHERLDKNLALGVLASDCISSSAYGTEEMLIVLLPVFGVAAVTILRPLTGVILAALLNVTLSYRDVASPETKPGASYLGAWQNRCP